jgi:DNA primase catalytic subunit
MREAYEVEISMDSGSPPLLRSRIRSYYRSSPIDLAVTSPVRFRHFRFRLEDGSFYKIKCKIRDSRDLRQYLVRKAPLDVYYSTACWLNPHALGSRVEKDVLKNLMISCDLAFDIDRGGKLELEDARQQAIAINEFLESKGISVRYSAFSGSKGFHVVCDDPWHDEITEENPRKRELEAIERRKRIVQEAKQEGIAFDEKVTVDTRRIIRLPGTINSKTGFVCTVLNKKELASGIYEIVKLARRHAISAPRIPLRKRVREMTHDFIMGKIPGLVGRLGVRPAPEERPCFSTFITSNIPGTRLKIPVLEFGGWRKVEEIAGVIKKVQSQYGIGDVFIFGDGNRFSALSLKAVSRRRVEKILFAAGSMNLNACKKYGCTFMRVGKSVGMNGKVTCREPELIRVLESDLRGQASRPHFEFLSSLGVKVSGEKVEFCGAGRERLELVHAVIE